MNALRTGLLAVTLAAASTLAGAQPAPEAQRPQSPAKVIRFPHMQVDLTAREIRVESTVCLRQGALELILCRQGSKEHESILHTRAKASQIHAGLLALGLAPGRPAEWSLQAGAEHPRLIPPRGAGLTIHVEWKTPDGTVHRADVGTWLAAINEDGKQAHALPKEWVFVGSDILENGNYWADADGDIISVSNFASTVIDVPFESSDKAAQLTYQANTPAIPAMNTPVTVIIKPLPDAKTAPDARLTYRISRDGAIFLGSTRLTLPKFVANTDAFVKKHPRTLVILRTDPYTIAHDVALAKRELMSVRPAEIRVEHGFLRDGRFPKTQADLDAAIQQWKDKFRKGDRMLIEPGEESAEVLTRLRNELKHTTRQRDLLADYEQWLTQARKEYVASTQPAAQPAPKNE